MENSLSKSEKSKRLKAIKPEFSSVFKMFNSPLCFFACRLVKDANLAQDIVTDVFMKFWEKKYDFDTLYSVKAFLYISTRNACINHNKRTNYYFKIKERVRYQNEMELLNINEFIYKDVLNLIYKIINKELPERCKKVMVMRFLEGLNTREIAKRMQISVNTVRNQITRGLQLIKESYAFKFIEELWEMLYDISKQNTLCQVN